MTLSVNALNTFAPTPSFAPATAPEASAHVDVGTPRGAYGRPAGDNRSAQEIFKDNPTLKDVLKQDGAFSSDFLNQLKQQTGDWSAANTNPESRANAAYNLAEVANYVDAREGLKRQDASQQHDQLLQGFGQFGSVSAGSEAQLLKAFSVKGYAALQ